MSSLIAEPLSHVAPTAGTRWLWPLYLARGTFAVLDGDPGIGKSLVTIDLAARLSRGAALPDGAPSERPHISLLLSAEDSPDTVRARAEAAGADLDFVIAVSAAGFALPAKLPDLEELIRAYAADLVVIDPLSAFLPPEAAPNLDYCVRRALGPLAALAARTGCAVILVRHLRKAGSPRATARGLGSVGMIAAARTALLAAPHPSDRALAVLAVSKSNLGVPGPSLSYRVGADAAGRPVVAWAGPVNLSADALGEPPTGVLPPRDRAVAWLRAELSGGPVPAATLYATAAEIGIPDRTLERAKVEVGARSHRVARGEGQEWFWYDPAAPWPSDAPFRRPFELPPL